MFWLVKILKKKNQIKSRKNGRTPSESLITYFRVGVGIHWFKNLYKYLTKSVPFLIILLRCYFFESAGMPLKWNAPSSRLFRIVKKEKVGHLSFVKWTSPLFWATNRF